MKHRSQEHGGIMPGILRLAYLTLTLGVALSLASCSKHRQATSVAPSQEVPPLVFYEVTETLLDGSSYPLSALRGQVVLISNIALECGTTPQLKGLEELHREFASQGLTVIGVPSNEFSGESVDDHSKIQTYCSKRFGVTFPLLKPGSLVGPDKRELFRFLTQHCAEDLAGEVSFNLEKFLIDRNGSVRARFGPFANPMSQHVRAEIKELLAEEAPAQ